ncbi:response regulator [Inquilinus sp. YAF38]|uniref:response regulator n=1 Tax=Inquilinus sp. YAF38 TaxID=3233084 RepID=UPI003F8EF2B2
MAKVLVVEDEPLLRIVAEDVVRSLGFEAIGAGDGTQAIMLAESSPDLEVLVTDIHLGPGPTGWQVANSIRQTHPNILVIYTSGLAGADDHSRHGLRNSVFLSKPITPEELAGAIRGSLPP